MPATLRKHESHSLAWFGVFVLTEARRVLFFPGIDELYDSVRGALSDGRSRFDRRLPFDHLTLEPDRRSWHLTGTDGRKRQGGATTRDVGHDRTLWFCITAPNLAELRPVKAKTIVRAACPPNREEAGRRVANFFSCVKNGAPAQLDLQPKPPAETVLHIAVVIGPPGAPVYDGNGMPVPLRAPGVDIKALPSGLTGSSAAAQLTPDIEVQLLAVWLPGLAPRGALTLSYTWDRG